MKKLLEIDDIVIVNNALIGEREYPVTDVGKDWAKTNFRTFNRVIKANGIVTEYKKRGGGSFYDNEYYLKENDTYTLEKKIAARDTELQRFYDLSVERLEKLKAEKYKLECRLNDIPAEIAKQESDIEHCKNRAIEQKCLHIL